MKAGEDSFLRREMMPDSIPYTAIHVLGFSIVFVFCKFLTCVRLTAVPLAVGGIVFFGLLSAYFSQLTEYLNAPSGEIGSRVLGIAALGPIIMTLIHSLLTASFAEVALNRKVGGPSYLGVRQWEWRLYVTNLRLVLLAGAGFMVYLAIISSIRFLGWPEKIENLITYVFLGCFFWLVIRISFFVLPICIDASENDILVRSWTMSAGHSMLLAAIVLPLLTAIALFQIGSEYLLHTLGVVSFGNMGTSIGSHVAFLQKNLMVLVVLVGVTYFFAMAILTSARIEAYRRQKKG